MGKEQRFSMEDFEPYLDTELKELTQNSRLQADRFGER